MTEGEGNIMSGMIVLGKDETPRHVAWGLRLTQIPTAVASLSKLQTWRLRGTPTSDETVGNDHCQTHKM